MAARLLRHMATSLLLLPGEVLGLAPPGGLQELTSRIVSTMSSPQLAFPSQATINSISDELQVNAFKALELLNKAVGHSSDEMNRQTQSLLGVLEKLQTQGLSIADLEAISSSLQSYLLRVSSVLSDPLLLSTDDLTQLVAFVVFPSVVGLKVYRDAQSAPTTPYPSGKYNAQDAADYFRNQPLLLLVRSLQLSSQSSVFLLNILSDLLRNLLTDPRQEARRAEELTVLLTRLGPSFIKAGQSLSIRTDLLRPAYYKALSKLQDRVPSYPTKQARAIIEEDLGVRVESVFSAGIEPDAKTIAAASLGQVYRARLTDGTEVAVKVQRPDILIRASLDMYLIRQIAPLLKKIFKLNSDLVGLVDEWATGFISELDYEEEARNAQLFSDSIKTTPLGDKVFAPQVLPELSSKRVLTTMWVDGVKIEQVNRTNASSFCALAMNSYLTMMLETGVLHADPHPGNLFITPEGKLCILDWGLVTRLDSNIQACFIDHIAHLTSKDYAAIPKDLVKLGFITAGKEKLVEEAGVITALTSVYSQLAGGGGARKINVAAVVDELTELTNIYGNLFQIPAYFAYIARAFGVLEGIGLSYDPNYAIIGECLPYISQRLLADKSEETGKALGNFIFGAERDSSNRVIDAGRFEMLIKGYGRYVVSSSDGISGAQKSLSIVERADQITSIIVELLLTDSSQPTPLQDIIVDELAKVLSAGARSTFTEIKRRSGKLPNGRSVIGSLLDPLNILPMSQLFDKDTYDDRVLEATEKLLSAINGSVALDAVLNGLTPLQARELVRVVGGKLVSRRIELLGLISRLSLTILKQNQPRLEQANIPLRLPSSLYP